MATTKNSAQKIKSTGFCLAGLKVDEDKAKNGIPFDFMGGCKLIIARGGSKGYNNYIANFFKENEKALTAGGEAADELGQRGFIEAAARFLLVGWEEVVDEEGNEVPYSVEAAEGYLAVDEIYEFVKGKSDEREHWRISATQKIGEELKK
ncbi:hypothetical protein vBVpaS1601_24 [Vibrio phage vB_VpaS_1601]|nr:hypothetical protein vBVpaP1601_24 [Vibrio phage vB_VpaP_1601]